LSKADYISIHYSPVISGLAHSENIRKITILGTPGAMSEKILRLKGQPMERKDLLLIIDVSDREKSITNLLECARALQANILAIKENIRNSGSRYASTSGQPPARKAVKIDAHGNILVTQIDDIQFVYDPTSPIAIKRGKCKGYVVASNINREREIEDLQRAMAEYHVIGQALKLIDPSLIIGEPEIPEAGTPDSSESLEKSRK